MSKIMETTPMLDLLERIAGEYRAKGSVYEIPELAFRKAFELEASSPGLEVMGGRASLPLGPAAGPHSQIAPNLVAAYLAGSRVFELKTVQENDSLDIEKPCIEALDEGHNVEWSTELSLVDAREEYLRGWIAVNLLAAIWSAKPRDFFFNMSVGYTLDGIRSAKVDAYIEGMRRPARTPFWKETLGEVARFVDGKSFVRAFGAPAADKARALLADFPASPLHSVTLSTMHGCPPEEIVRIGAYLIEEKGFDTYVKLNPTLLGFDAVRGILDSTGWTEIGLKRETFERDLQFKDALALIRSLSDRAEGDGRRFGVKLSNTLANSNDGGFLPGSERYMSGRALFPVTARLAAELAAALPEFAQRFSYCGGVSALNAADLVASGLGPLTVATDILKPGGYLRLLQTAEAAVGALPGSPDRPDAKALSRLAEAALSRPEYRKEWKAGTAVIKGKLPLFDCFAAPCVEACPVSQRVPEYLNLAGSEVNEKAIASILADNPLPFVTGTLCDHVCQEACCRNDYEGSVEIRAVKLGCARTASVPVKPAPRNDYFKGKAAVIGAGPAGLSCAYHLALAGAAVTVFDKSREPGGVPANVIPRFRMVRAELAADIDRIKSLGVEFRLGVEVIDLKALEAEGFTRFFACTGAPIPRELPIQGSGIPVVDALAFLEAASAAERGAVSSFSGAKHIVVAGGGNTAMDAVRAATRLPGLEEVHLSYRRSVAEMPADAEERRNALREGGELNSRSGDSGIPVLLELTLPERAEGSKRPMPELILRRMKLGEKDASGRRSPAPSGETLAVPCDLLVAAVGEMPDTSLLEALGASCGGDGRPLVNPETQSSSRAGLYVGGDASRGPASIIAAVADGRRAAYAMLREAGIEPPTRDYSPTHPDAAKLAARGSMKTSLPSGDPAFSAREAERCLACDSACLRCVEVCPNRANVAIAPTLPSQGQAFQILHVDYLCNECGNCGLFCPWEGEPFRGKATLFADSAAMKASRNAGFAFQKSGPARHVFLRLTYDGPVDEINGETFASSKDEMTVLARTVALSHPYLLGGAE